MKKIFAVILILFFLEFFHAEEEHDHSEEESREPTVAEKYGYGTIAIVIVSLITLVGFLILPCFKKSIFDHVLTILTALAASSLFCDTLLHIIPQVVGLHGHNHGDDEEEHEDHGEENKIVVEDYVIKLCVSIAVLYILWLFEILIHHFSGKSRFNGNSHGHSHGISMQDDDDETSYEGNKISSTNSDLKDLERANSDKKITKENKKRGFFQNLKRIKAAGWIVLVGDGLHNFADGLAVGASFAQSLNLGISTSIAVVCHEIPHELGTYAVLMKSGFSFWQALIFNLITALSCLIGFYVGVSVSDEEEARKWIFTITAGMFLYIALVDLLPSVMTSKKWNWVVFGLCNLAMILGFIFMFLLAIFEEHIKI
ncbi:zinc transporter ZIP4 [Brachionus plicatilis]|uniref:Zinc transporter ZIP4 n=1 Tax=Brachionus plicatilis TaxID=10195 RepID=A0A3M7TB27_BRAPC|nr:zinc transporter ZIP4 [Brachionus plicatilis]